MLTLYKKRDIIVMLLRNELFAFLLMVLPNKVGCFPFLSIPFV